jgi:MSHA biogenesis protein MshI
MGFVELEAAGRDVLDDVVLELQRSLDYFESQFAQALPAKLLIYPPDKISGELMMHIHSHLNLEVEPLILEKMPGFTFDNDEESQSRCLLAVGAALREDDEAAA